MRGIAQYVPRCCAFSIAVGFVLLAIAACGARDNGTARSSVDVTTLRFVGTWLSDGPERGERQAVLLLSSRGQALVNFSIFSECGIGSWSTIGEHEIVVRLAEACDGDSNLPIPNSLRFARRPDGRLAEMGTEPGEIVRLWHRLSCDDPREREFAWSED